MNKIIAVDFDGTICRNKWPDIGEENRFVIKELKRRQERGDKIILWTCRSDGLLDKAVDWCMERGLFFDAINDNLPEMKEQFGNNCRKVFANEYWDDRNVLVFFNNLCWIVYDKPGFFERIKRKTDRITSFMGFPCKNGFIFMKKGDGK